MCICMYVYVCVCVCIYIYIYTYTHTHTHTHTFSSFTESVQLFNCVVYVWIWTAVECSLLQKLRNVSLGTEACSVHQKDENNCNTWNVCQPFSWIPVLFGNEDYGGLYNYSYTISHIFTGYEVLRHRMYVLGSSALNLLTVGHIRKLSRNFKKILLSVKDILYDSRA
jgi:hypothetical protein